MLSDFSVVDYTAVSVVVSHIYDLLIDLFSYSLFYRSRYIVFVLSSFLGAEMSLDGPTAFKQKRRAINKKTIGAPGRW